MISTIQLNNQKAIPMIGLGTFQLLGDTCTQIVSKALHLGYRHIDTASKYGNEAAIGEALLRVEAKFGIRREEIFITSKVWNSDQGYETTLKSFDQSLKRLKSDYLDLYLIHWPQEKILDTWKAMERLYREKKVKAIGVSNFKEHHLRRLIDDSPITPVINQVELHPRFSQEPLRKFCQTYGIKIAAWAPLARGKVLNHPWLVGLAKKYHRTTAQIVLRWHLQKNIIVIPKTASLTRLEENLELEGFEIDQKDLDKIDQLNHKRIWTDPDQIDF